MAPPTVEFVAAEPRTAPMESARSRGITQVGDDRMRQLRPTSDVLRPNCQPGQIESRHAIWADAQVCERQVTHRWPTDVYAFGSIMKN